MQCAVPSCTGWAKQVIPFPQNLMLQSRWKRAIEAGTGLRIPTYHCGGLCLWHFGENQAKINGYWEPYRFLHKSGITVEVGSCRFCLRFDERKKMIPDNAVLENAELVVLVKHAMKINLTKDGILKDICEECDGKVQVIDKWLKRSKKIENEYKALEVATKTSVLDPQSKEVVVSEPVKYKMLTFEVECMQKKINIEQSTIEVERPVTPDHGFMTEELPKVAENIPVIAKKESLSSRPLKPVLKKYNFPPNIHSKRGVPRKPKLTQQKVNYREYFSKKCYICDTLLDSPEDLVAHLTQRHCNGTPYKCLECNKTFKIITSYNRHLRFHDQSTQPLKCCFCTMGFKYMYSLLNHENRQHGAGHSISVKKKPTEKSFRCLKCDKLYKTNYDLLDHDRYVHQKLLGTSCKLCDKQFRNRASLRKHHLVHTADRPYNCLQCDATYRNTTGLANHVARKHAVQDVPVLEVNVKGGVNEKECDVCSSKFSTKRDLVKHIESAHLGIT